MNLPLKLTQSAFQQYVLEGDRMIAAQITGPDAACRDIRLGIYFSAYRLRLTDVLASDFAKLKRFAGEQRFNEIARDYIAAYPSNFRNVRWYGGGLPAFLREDARYRGEPVLAELASFEWAIGLAFDAPDAPLLGLQALGGLAAEQWANLHLLLHPSLDTLASSWNVTAIWQAADTDQPPPCPEPAPRTRVIAAWRRDHTAYFRSLPEDEALALEKVRAGCSFGEMCEATASLIGKDASAARVAECLQTWINDGWIADYALPSGE
ncbi:MAG TPA: DNA-binding domain-containing protein [Burkholderiales bacterium]|nr:DNA-binding domain-containing protein [Burkholderiales bacterium]